MKLSDQIALVTEALAAYGGLQDGESAGEAAARVLRANKLRIAELEDAAAATTEGLCDSCAHLSTFGQMARLCQNPEAFRQGLAKRGHPTAATHGCELWAARAGEPTTDARPPAWRGQGLTG